MNRISQILLLLIMLFSCRSTENFVSSEKSASSNDSSLNKMEFLKHSQLIEYLSSAPTIEPNRKIGRPFDTLHYNKLIAYDFDGRHETRAVIDRSGRYVYTIIKQQYLNQTQADEILKALCNKSTYGEKTAACFEPHFALVFYQDKQMVNQVNVCLDCNYLISTIDIPAQSKKTIKIDSCDYPQIGFSKKGRKAITRLCKELNFMYGSY